MPTPKKMNDVIALADYVLSGDNEKDVLRNQLSEALSHLTRGEKRIFAEDHIWYKAVKIRDGRASARKQLTDLLNEVDEQVKRGTGHFDSLI